MFVSVGQIDIKSTSIQVMACCEIGIKPSPESGMTQSHWQIYAAPGLCVLMELSEKARNAITAHAKLHTVDLCYDLLNC